MAVDLFSLRMNMETSGLGQAKAELTGVEASAKQATLAATNFGNAWEVAKLKFEGSAAEMAAFKASFSSGFFNEKMIAGMSLSGQEAAKAAEGSNKWAAGLSNLRAQNEAAAAATKTHSSALAGLGSSLAGLAAVYAGFKFVGFIKGTIDSAGALHEMSQRTGATVEMLSVLRFAGAQAEVSAEQITIGFKGMAISLGNLRDGQEKTVEAYKKLGFTADSFKGLNPDQTFIKLATAIGGMKDETERSEVSMRVFGRSGSALLPLLEDIAHKGFGAIQEETRKNGGLITKEMADKSDALTDSMTRLSGSFRALMVGALVPIMPWLTAFVDGLTRAVNLMKEVGTSGWMAALMVGGLKAREAAGTNWEMNANDAAALGGFGDVSSGSSNSLTGPADKQKAAGTKMQETAAARQRRLLGVLDAEAERQLSGGGPLSFGGARTDIIPTGGAVTNPAMRPGVKFMDTLKQDLFEGMQRLQPFAQGLQGFFQQLFQTGRIGSSLKQFGQSILAGMGSIFSQMAMKAIAAAPLFQAIGAAMRNPFTAGFALLAFGIALKALGASMGGTATGSGGGGSSSFGDRTTNIRLTAADAGGVVAPEGKTPVHYHVLGKDSPEGQRMLGEYVGAAKRSRNI